MGTYNRIAFFNIKYHDTILWILWGFWATSFIVPHNHPLAFLLYATTGALWMRWIYFTQKLRKWGNTSFGRMVIIFLLWAATGIFFGLIVSRISSFIQIWVGKLWHTATLILNDPRLTSDPQPVFDFVAFVAIAVGIPILLGILIVLIQKRNERLFRYMSIINIPLMVFSIYMLAKKIINYNSKEDDFSIIIIQCVFLFIALVLDLYNRRKESVMGESSRAHYVVLVFEFIIYLQFILYSLLFQ